MKYYINNLVNAYLNSAVDSISVHSFASAKDDVMHIMDKTSVSPEMLNVVDDINSHNANATKHDVKSIKQAIN